jgi:hypothetical protein
VSKLQDNGKDALALHSAPNHKGLWDSTCIIQILLSRDNKRKEVVNFTTEQTYPYHGKSGRRFTQQEAQQNPEWV